MNRWGDTIAAVVASTLVSALFLAGCVAGPSGPSTAGAVASQAPSSPTLNPNQLEEQHRSIGATGSPAISPITSAGPTASAVYATRPTPTPFDPALEAALPTSLRGIALQRRSVPLSSFDTGGDLCILICPAEPKALASSSGLAEAKITVAAAIAAQDSGLRALIVAIRFPGVATSRLVDIRIGEKAILSRFPDVPPRRTAVGAAPATAEYMLYPPFFQTATGEYLLARGDILFIVFGDPPTADGQAPGDVLAAIVALAGS
jgi:hypothetical protein